MPKAARKDKINLLVNLPEGFLTTPVLRGVYRRLGKLARLRKRSHDTADQIAPDLAWADAVIMWSWPELTDELLDGAPKLRFAGMLDVKHEAARRMLRRGLAVSLSKHGWSPAVAEMALGLILSALRRITDYQSAMRAGREKWLTTSVADADPRERQLTGRPVGIIGLGAVGRRLAELLRPFGCTLRVYDPYVPEAAIRKARAERASLMELLKKSEVVVLCAANNPGTRNLLGAKQIAAFRKDAVFVNVARAALVDTDALVKRLKKGDMCAALDVFDREPLAKNSPLRKLPNAYLTPHRAGGILESLERVVGYLAEDLEAFLAGKRRRHALKAKMLPALDG